MVRREVLFLPVVAFAIGAMCGPVDDEQRKPTIISTAQLSVDPEIAVKLLPETESPTRDQDEELPKDSSTPVASESNEVGTGITEPSANNGSTGTTKIDESYTEEGRTTLMAEVPTTLKPKGPENSTVADLNATTTTIVPFERSTTEEAFSTTNPSVTTEPSANNGSTGTTKIDESYTEEGRTTLMAEVPTTLKPKGPENSTVADLNATTTTIIPFERSTTEEAFSTTNPSVTTEPSANNGSTGTTKIDESYTEEGRTTLMAEVPTTLKPKGPENSTVADLNATTTTTIIPFERSTSEEAFSTTNPSVTQPSAVTVTVTHNPEAPVTTTVAGVTTTPEPPASSTSQAVTTVRVDTTSAEAGTTATTPGTSSSTGIGSETTVTTIEPETTTSGVGLLTSGGVVLLASLVVSWL